jgi:mRNA-degrading endonuclease RelE of RelBE toxin-antitoxin system
VYKVKYRKQVIKFLQGQTKSIREKVIGFFEEIKEDPYAFKTYDAKAMQGLDNHFRLRAPLKTLNTHNGLCKCEILQEAFKS